MRTSIRLDDDVAAAAKELQRVENIGFGQAVNLLARRGVQLTRPGTTTYRRPRPPRSLGGARIDLTNTGDALEILEGPAHP